MSDLLHFHVQSLLELQMPSVIQEEAQHSSHSLLPIRHLQLHDRSKLESCRLMHCMTYLSSSKSQMWLWNVIPHRAGSLLSCSSGTPGASQHNLHHQDATRICCAALPIVLCDSAKAVAAGFTDLTLPERFLLACCSSLSGRCVASTAPQAAGATTLVPSYQKGIFTQRSTTSSFENQCNYTDASQFN